MTSRRTFLKILAGIAGFVLPWTVLPERLGHTLESWLGKPAVLVDRVLLKAPAGMVSPDILSRKAIDDIEVLSDPAIQGRRAGTTGETKALVYLEQQVRALNLEPWGTNAYWQIFSIPHMDEKIVNGRALFRPAEKEGLSLPGSNLLAALTSEDSEGWIILSAHYDHLGIYQGRLHPGANDNASGVGCVLQVVRLLVQESEKGPKPKKNILIALWGAEEMGILGSKHFVKNPLIPLSQIKAVINIDTVGNGSRKDFMIWSEESADLVNLVQKIGVSHQANLELVAKNGHLSDEAAFVGTGIPALTILSKTWLEKNHTPDDNLTLINEEKLDTVVQMVYDIVKKLAY